MKLRIKVKIIKYGVIALGVIIFLVLVLGLLGLRYVEEESMPKGIYRKVSGAPEVNEPVVIKLDKEWSDYALARGYVTAHRFEDREKDSIKWLVGKEGDLVSIKQEGIRINGRLLNFSAQRIKDSAGRLMPTLKMEKRKLDAEEYIVISHLQERGFDSRYYGTVKASNIVSKAELLYCSPKIDEGRGWLYAEE